MSIPGRCNKNGNLTELPYIGDIIEPIVNVIDTGVKSTAKMSRS